MSMLTNILSPDQSYSHKWRIDKMEETKAIFEKEEAVRLLNYLISYRKMTENEQRPEAVSIGVLPKVEKIVRE